MLEVPMLARPMLLAAALASCCLCECAATRIDQPSHAKPAAVKPDPDADALRGPTLTESPDRPKHSIVERDFNGRVKKTEEHPVLLALSRLELTAEEKAAADKVLTERAAALDTIVRDNLKLIVEFAQAKQSSDAASLKTLQPQLLERAQPFFQRGSMLSELISALPEDKFTELRKMVQEYNSLSAHDRAADTSVKEKPNRLGTVIAMGFENFAAEARASYERVVGAGGKEFDALLKNLQLTPEQDAKIRQKALDLYQKTYGKPTKKQQFNLFLSIYADLDTEQRHRLAQYIGEENKAKRTPKAATKS
jgi:hypothetical protein